ncbi:MAG TPA: sulfatase-like hydrolase/transferase [Bryobacteraceae bacterium]|nr:sulfatase-like hydrolase/transferase [Bryobacteraceae bacterium]
MLTRRQFAALAALPAAKRPNVLLVVAGQWKRQRLPGGDPDAPPLPNLARLAKGGLWLPRAYTVNPAPACAHAVLQTGRYPHAAGVPWEGRALPPDAPGLAGGFAAAGYAAGFVGLWPAEIPAGPAETAAGPGRHGFTEWAALSGGRRYADGVHFKNGNNSGPAGGLEPDSQTELALDFLRRRREEPFFLQIAFGASHRTDSGEAGSASYNVRCAAIDKNMGKLLDALDAYRLSANTLLVFTSDAGEPQPEDWRESSVGVPLLLRWPDRLPASASQDWLCANVDIAPLLGGIGGLAPLESAQGIDRSKLLFVNGVGERPESIYLQGRLGTPAEWRAVVRGWDKLVVDRERRVTHLFNLAQDPREQDNLAVDRATLRRQEELLALMRRWMITAGDRVPYPGRAPQ